MTLPGGMAADVAAVIGQVTGRAFVTQSQAQASGGCINQSVVLTGRDGRRFFLKINQATQAEMFAAEAASLQALQAAGAVHVPEPVAQGLSESFAWLVLSFLSLGHGKQNPMLLGRQLAALHQVTSPMFGWHRDNFIGSTPQVNATEQSWIVFFRDQRLRPQLELGHGHWVSGRVQQLANRLLEVLDRFFDNYGPVPSLLHGDIWSGNYGYLQDGTPVLFDPAVYFGDREADLAMTELFGGFPPDFYAAYREAWPLDSGYAVRRDLYNLYHVMNHANLFGGGYARQAEQMMSRLLAEIH